jgi:hypothetical protein
MAKVYEVLLLPREADCARFAIPRLALAFLLAD